MENKITAVIPIRGGSKRCKNKSLRKFADTSLLELRINILKRVNGIHRIVVNSDSDAILSKAKNLGVDTYKRDPIYAQDDTDGKMLYKCLAESCTTDIMLIVFTPTPFITEHDYKKCIDIFLEGKYDSVISVKYLHDFIFYKKTPLNFDPMKTCQSQQLPEYYKMTFGVTVVPTDFVRQYHSIWTQNPYFYKVDELKAMDIDTNMDFFICEEIYKKNLQSLEALDNHVDNCMIVENSITPKNATEIPDDVYLGAVYDALNKITETPMKHVLTMKPQCGYTHLVHGPALTLYGRKIRKNENYEKLDNYRFNFYDTKYYKENPIVILQSNDNVISHVGDITTKIFKKLGAVGFITDGITRDSDLINELQFPIFCNDINPIDAISNNWAYTDINIPIQIENLIIYPNDYVFASRDGIIVVPQELKKTFVEQLHEILNKERKIREFVENTSASDLKERIETFIEKNGRF
jgi:CMP-N-acetylneuraminic acid synthetase/regulator of RNase E activity RraA